MSIYDSIVNHGLCPDCGRKYDSLPVLAASGGTAKYICGDPLCNTVHRVNIREQHAD